MRKAFSAAWGLRGRVEEVFFGFLLGGGLAEMVDGGGGTERCPTGPVGIMEGLENGGTERCPIGPVGIMEGLGNAPWIGPGRILGLRRPGRRVKVGCAVERPAVVVIGEMTGNVTVFVSETEGEVVNGSGEETTVSITESSK